MKIHIKSLWLKKARPKCLPAWNGAKSKRGRPFYPSLTFLITYSLNTDFGWDCISLKAKFPEFHYSIPIAFNIAYRCILTKMHNYFFRSKGITVQFWWNIRADNGFSKRTQFIFTAVVHLGIPSFIIKVWRHNVTQLGICFSHYDTQITTL